LELCCNGNVKLFVTETLWAHTMAGLHLDFKSQAEFSEETQNILDD
jgi:hypothetical protein